MYYPLLSYKDHLLLLTLRIRSFIGLIGNNFWQVRSQTESFKPFTFPVNYSCVTAIKETFPSPLTSSVSYSVSCVHCGYFESRSNTTYRADYFRLIWTLTICAHNMPINMHYPGGLIVSNEFNIQPLTFFILPVRPENKSVLSSRLLLISGFHKWQTATESNWQHIFI